jgi:hypothetical protein
MRIRANRKENMFGVPHAGHKDITRMSAQLSRSTWKQGYQTLVQQGDHDARSVKHMEMIHIIVQ